MKPMLCSSVKSDEEAIYLIRSDDWFVQEKMYGERLIVAGNVGYNRNGMRTFVDSKILKQISGLVIFDGELVNNEVYYVFDIIHAELPAIERLTRLQEILEETDNIRCVRTAIKDKKEFVQDCIERNSEGVVFKHNDFRYKCGIRSTKVLKYKFVDTATCFIMNLQAGLSAELGMFNDVGAEISVGTCKIPPEVLPLIVPGDVVEINYLSKSADHRLSHIVWCRVRRDKQRHECILT